MTVQLPVLLGGVFPADASVRERWPAAVTWQMPVGAGTRLGLPGPDGEAPYKVNRGIERNRRRATHQGADIANGHDGGPVHAAASGMVLLAYDGDNGNGYGGHVVIAHRLSGGRQVLTIYAHLLARSLAVRPGDVVAAGDVLGRVGQTGRASTPHLHFEVREPHEPGERWERARVLDPLAFVAAHLEPAGPATDPHTAETAPYARWAAEQGLLDDASAPGDPLTRAAWWRMLARGSGHATGVSTAPEALRDSLMASGLLPEEEADAPADESPAWAELARDVVRLHAVGVRTAHGPLAAAEHQDVCERRTGARVPAEDADVVRRHGGDPAVADACVLLADASGPRPEPQYGRADPHGRTPRLHRGRHRRHAPSRAHRTGKAKTSRKKPARRAPAAGRRKRIAR